MRSTIGRSRFGRVAAAITAVALLATACSGDDDDDEPADEPVADEPSDDDGDDVATDDDDGDDAPELDGDGLTIGFIQPEVGLFDLLGAAQAGGLALAADDIAAGGGVLGGELTIVAERPTPDVGVTAVFESMVADTSSLIVGPATSAEARQIIPLLASNDAVVCGASTTSPGLTTLEGANGRFVRTTFDDNIVAIHTFDRVREYTADVIGRQPKVTIVSRGDEYGDGISNTLAGLLGIVGIEVTVERYDPANIVGLDDVAASVAATQADLYLVIGLEEGPQLTGRMQQAGIAPDTMLGLDGLATPRLGEKGAPSAPETLDGVTVIGATGPIDFLTRLLGQQAAESEVLYGAQAYDCAISYALAVEAAGSADPAEVSAALRTVTGGDGTICTTYADCKALLDDGIDIDYSGPSGPIDFAEDGEPGGGRFLTARSTTGTLTVVADLTIALEELRDRVAPRLVGFIADIQTALTELGYYSGPIDGQESDEFREAVAAFQADNGLEPTGTLDAATIAAIQAALGENPILTATIIEVQQLLTELGYYTGPIDGVFSEELSNAIKAFQTDLGVEPTGILDAATLRAIYQAGVEAGGNQPPETTVPPATTTPPPATTTPPPATTTPPPATTTPPPATTTPPPATSVPQSAIDVLTADGQFTQFLGLLTQPVLQAIPELEDPDAEITLFAPNDDALTGIGFDPSGLSQQEIIALVQFHVVDEALGDVSTLNGEYPTLLDDGGIVTVLIDGTTTPGQPTYDGIVFVPTPIPTTGGFVYSLNGAADPSA